LIPHRSRNEVTRLADLVVGLQDVQATVLHRERHKATAYHDLSAGLVRGLAFAARRHILIFAATRCTRGKASCPFMQLAPLRRGSFFPISASSTAPEQGRRSPSPDRFRDRPFRCGTRSRHQDPQCLDLGPSNGARRMSFHASCKVAIDFHCARTMWPGGHPLPMILRLPLSERWPSFY
jgi:hypothetical protein